MHHTRTYYWFSFLIPVIALSGVKSKAGRGSSWAYLWCVGWAMIPSMSNVDTKWFDAKCQSTRWIPWVPNFWVGVRNGVGEKNCPYLKGTPALPPLDWEKPQHYKWWCDVWRMWFVSNGIIECHIENLKIEMGSWTPNCLRHHVWLDVSTLNKRLFATKQRWLLLILICEASQIFVWRNKAFIFFQKSDILFLLKTRIDWD